MGHCSPHRLACAPLARALLALCLGALLAGPARAQPADSFYRGKQITLLINSGAGGGYDSYARIFARSFARHVPGTPVIVPKNLPGAGGLLAANTLYGNSDKDGLTLAALANTAGLSR